jgi:hypothetical protein
VDIVLGTVGSIVGGAVTHLFSPPSAGPLPSRGTNRFHSWSDCSFVRLAQVLTATTSRVERSKAVQVTRPTKGRKGIKER